jgi:hypothetical protein
LRWLKERKGELRRRGFMYKIGVKTRPFWDPFYTWFPPRTSVYDAWTSILKFLSWWLLCLRVLIDLWTLTALLVMTCGVRAFTNLVQEAWPWHGFTYAINVRLYVLEGVAVDYVGSTYQHERWRGSLPR